MNCGYGSGLSLTGKKMCMRNNLAGKTIIEEGGEPTKLKEFKMIMMSKFVIPLIQKKWHVVNENLYRIDIHRKRLDEYCQLYPKSDLELYKYIIHLVSSIYSEHTELADIEKKMYENVQGAATLAQKTTRIRLRAEYELYNLILGRPTNGEHYDDLVLGKIKNLLMDESLSVDDIKDRLLH